MATEVFVALRHELRRACVGYFATEEEIPEDWVLSGTRNIEDVMASLRRSKEDTLKVMNEHWARRSSKRREV